MNNSILLMAREDKAYSGMSIALLAMMLDAPRALMEEAGAAGGPRDC